MWLVGGMVVAMNRDDYIEKEKQRLAFNSCTSCNEDRAFNQGGIFHCPPDITGKCKKCGRTENQLCWCWSSVRICSTYT